MSSVGTEQWQTCRNWELKWWESLDHFSNSLNEEMKHQTMAAHMGIPFDNMHRIDLNGATVLDMVGGPVSILLKTHNTRRRIVVDPLVDEWPQWIRDRYEYAGIETVASRGEDFDQREVADLVLIYNCLQHVSDPVEVLRHAVASLVPGGTLRIFEWVNTGVSDGHIHNLTKDFLTATLTGLGLETVDQEDVTCDWDGGWKSFAFAGVFKKSGGEKTIIPGPRAMDRTEPLRFHIPAIPHTVTDKDRYTSCAFTCKVDKMCKMLTRLGHEVYHYGCEGAKVEATEVIDVVSDQFRMKTYPEQEDRTKQYQFNEGDDYHKEFYGKTILSMRQRQQPYDFLLCPWGTGHKPIADSFPEMTVVESGIGYPHTFAPFKVFESYWWMAHVYGNTQFNQDGKFYDCVIPNQFEVEDFDYGEEREDFFLYLGRIVKRKGVEVAVEATKRIGAKLVIAGQGQLLNTNEGIDLRGDHVTFAGYADVEKRRDLMRRAKAIFMPTYFLEPFGGVAVEAMMSGCPVISTDWGAFTETVLHGITGYRCRTLEQFTWAAENIGNIRPLDCRNWAVDNYSLEACMPKYEEYFRMLQGLRGKGWYEDNPDRTELDWLTKRYPREVPS